MKTKILTVATAAAVLAMFAVSCSSGNGGEDTHRPTTTTTAAAVAISASTTSAASSASTTVAEATEAVEPASLTLRFETSGSAGNITISGDSPVAEWFASQPGEITLDLFDADIDDAESVVGELISFWFFRDDNSGDVPPSIFESPSGEITDSVGTRYVVEAQPLPPAPGTETAATDPATTTAVTSAPSSTVPSASSVPSEAPDASVPPSTTTATSATTTTTTTTEAAAPVTTAPVAAELSPAELRVQVLNGSGVAGAAGRLSDSLEDAGYSVLPAANAPGRFGSSAVYFVAAEHRDEAELVAEVVAGTAEEVGEVAVAGLPGSGEISAGDANVVVLIGRDTLGDSLRTAERTSGLRRTPDADTPLPLAADIPRDRYVPGLADVQIFTEANDNGTDEMKGLLNALSGWFNVAGRYQSVQLTADREEHQDYEYLINEAYPNIEAALEWLGFTPQNVCGAPQGYSFTDLLKPTREFSEETQSHAGDAIFTTDRLIELHGGERINPESNLDFYVREAAQTAYDSLRLSELLDETEAPQMILCRAWKRPSGEIPEGANAYWYALLTPGIQPRESLLSQGTYHLKEISRNGNFAYLIACHPTIGARFVALHWREAGYRAEVVEDIRTSGCQAAFEEYDDYFAGLVPSSGSGDYFTEDTISFSFGERVFSAGDMLEFPRG